MPRVIQFPPSDPFPSGDDGRLSQAWAAFAAEDAQASAPARLEKRVRRAVQAALVEQRRAEAERRRHQWLAGLSALAATVLAAAAWWLAGSRAMSPNAPDIVTVAERSAPVAASGTTVRASRRASAPVPMTNVEAGRLLDGAPRTLAARPLLESADNGLVRVAGVPRAKSFSAPLVVPAPIPLRASKTSAPVPQAEDATALPGPLGVAPPAGTATAPDAWTSRGFNGVFDPASGQHPPAPPAAKPSEEPPPPPPD